MMSAAAKSWMLYGIAGVAIAGLVLGAYYMGRASYRAEAAEAQTAAVAAAHEEARERWQGALEAQRARAADHRARTRELEAELDAADDRIATFQGSEAGQRQCLGEEGRKLWDEL